MDALAATLKAAYPRALATLIRLLRDIDAAEDGLQEAVTRALEVWPGEGIPGNPVAWLVTAGRNKAIDLLRRYKLEVRHRESLAAMVDHNPADSQVSEAVFRQYFNDDLLRLIFTCCHPALTQEEQIALTLKTVAGLTVPEIARAFLVPPKTLEQRLTRAKRKLRDARVPYAVPTAPQLPARLAAVLAVIYLQQAQNSPLPLWQDTMGCFLKSAPERCGNEKSQRQSCCSETLLSTGVSSMPRV